MRSIFGFMKQKHEEYLNSPFTFHKIEERLFTTRDDETLTINPDTGEYYVMRKVAKDKKILHDSLTYTKLFVDSAKRLMSLSPSALKVLVYGMVTAKPVSLSVILNPSDVCLFCEIGISSYNNAIYELLTSKIIAKKLGSSIEFWFDPNVFFNGNRLRVCK